MGATAPFLTEAYMDKNKAYYKKNYPGASDRVVELLAKSHAKRKKIKAEDKKAVDAARKKYLDNRSFNQYQNDKGKNLTPGSLLGMFSDYRAYKKDKKQRQSGKR